MTHFATSVGTPSPAEAEIAAVVDDKPPTLNGLASLFPNALATADRHVIFLFVRVLLGYVADETWM